ncbi:MAG: polysaccharide deacetylase family protein [Clostridia bacterium]|nr:polysaccharide deacetylase family protein [Clostridia bacterium]
MKVFVITKKTLLIIAGALLAVVLAVVLALALGKGTEEAPAASAPGKPAEAAPVFAETRGGLLSSEDEYELAVLAGFKKELPVYSVERSDGRIALTIDAAWDDDKTPFILETLKRYNVKATFFLCGSWVKAYPDMVRTISEAGHSIGNHSMSHPHMTKISEEKMLSEINALDDLLEKITGKRTVLFRAPYGEYNDSVITTVRASGHEPVQWDVDTIDWKPERSSQTILDTVLPKLGDGSIILCHNNGFKIEEYLPTLIETAQANGFEFVTVDELLLKGETIIDVNGRQKLK